MRQNTSLSLEEDPAEVRSCCIQFIPSYTNLTSLSKYLHATFNLSKMVQISEVKGNARDNRTFAHTHIKGLGLKPDGTAERQAAGFVGQAAAREVKLNSIFTTSIS